MLWFIKSYVQYHWFTCDVSLGSWSLFSLLPFFLELFVVFDWGWCLVFSALLFFLVFPSFTISWVVFFFFNIIYVCFDRSYAIRVHDEWFFTCSICFYKYVQATARGEEGMMLFSICCNLNCGHRWRDWESKFWW